MKHYLQKELYQLIREDERIFDFIQEGSLDGLWYWDLDKPENEWMNAKFWTVLGYDPSTMPHKASAWQDIINQDDLKVALDNFYKHVADPEHPYDQEVRYKHKKGHTIWVRCRGLAIRNEEGKAIRMLGAHQDITALKESKFLLDKMIDQSPFAMWISDEKGLVQRINSAQQKLLGIPEEDFVGKYNVLEDKIAEKAGLMPQIKSVFEEGKTINFTLEWDGKDMPGKKFKKSNKVTGKTTMFPVFDNDKKLTNVVSQWVDITKVVETDKKLKESEEKYRLIFETAANFITSVNKDGIIVDCNNHVQEILGYDKSEIIGNPMTKIMHPDYHQKAFKSLKTIMSQGYNYKQTYKMLRKDGSITDVNINASAIYSKGVFERTICIIDDITERLLAEKKVLESEAAVRRKLKAIAEPDGKLETLGLADILDAQVMQKLLDDFSSITGMCSGITDFEGNVLASVGWRDACALFHRANPESKKNCIESDTILSDGIAAGEFKLYKCKNNMWEAASPITIANQHMGNIFFGQFFYDDEEINLDQFRHQASTYGYKQDDYLKAIKEVPRYSKETIQRAISMFSGLAEILSAQSYSNIKLSRAISQAKIAEKALKQSEARLATSQQIAQLGNFEHDFKKDTVWWSDELYAILGFKKANTPPNFETFIKRAHPQDGIKLTNLVERAIKYGENYKMTFGYTLPNNEEKYIYVNAEVIFDKNNKPKGLKGTAQDVTKLHLAENSLKQSEEKFRGVFEESIVGIAIGSAQGDVLEVNNEYLKITGYSHSEFVNLNYSEVTHPDDLLKELPLFEQLHKGAIDSYRIEKRLIAKNGEYVWLDCAITGRRDANGKIDQTVAVVVDITEGKKAADTVHAFFEQPMNIHLIGSLDGTILKLNTGWEEILGYDKSDSEGKNIFDFIHPNEIEKTNKEIAELANGKTTFYFENQYRHKKGHYITLAWSAIFNTSAKLMHGVAKDITQQRAYRDALLKSEANYKALAENAKNIILTHNFKGEITYINQSGIDFIKLPKEEIIGTDVRSLLYEDKDIEDLKSRIKEYEKGDYKIHQYEARIKGPTGENRLFEIIGSPFISNDKLDSILITAYDITERKLAEDKIRESEEKLRLAIDNSPVGITINDMKGHFISVNKAYEKIVGYTEEELLNMSFFEITHPDYLPNNKKLFNSMASNAKAGFAIEKKYIHKNGSHIDVKIIAGSIKDNNGNTLFGMAFTEDITKEKAAAQELQKLYDELKIIYENDPSFIIFKDTENNILNVTDSVAEMTGLPKEEIEGKPAKEIYPDMADKYYKDDLEVMKSGQPKLGIIEPLPTADGKTKWLLTNKIPYKDKNDKLKGIILFSTDISQLKLSEQRFERAEQIGRVGNWEYDIEKKRFWASEEAKILFGFNLENQYISIEEAESRIIDHKRTNKALYDLINHNIPYKLDYDIAITEQGIKRSFHSVAVLEKDSTGKAIKVSGVIQDITERRKYEQKIETQNEEYEILNEELIQTNEALIKAKDKAEESDKLKSSFLANMSHEIRTPMNGILGFLEILQEPDISEYERDEFLKRIRRSGDRLLNTINDIIEFSMIDSGNIQLNYQTIPIKECIDDHFKFFELEASKKGIELKTDIDEKINDLVIKSDKTKIDSVITNLIKNALKFTDKGSVLIKCEQNKNHLKFAVKDTGIGIARQKQEVIFERFRQAENTVTKDEEGSGLGLAISKAYIEKLGGDIWLESELNKGSSFYFTIPLG